jgi:hypothetical protein
VIVLYAFCVGAACTVVTFRQTYKRNTVPQIVKTIKPVVLEETHLANEKFLWILVASKCSSRSVYFGECIHPER